MPIVHSDYTKNKVRIVVYCEVFPFTVIYSEKATDEELEKLAKDWICEKTATWPKIPENLDLGMFTRYFGAHSLIYCPDRASMKKKEWRKYLSHECQHAVHNALLESGLGIDRESFNHGSFSLDEPFNYTHGWLCEELGVWK